MNSWLLGSAAVCAAMLALATGNLGIAGSLTGVCDLVAVASSIIFVGLMDGA